MEILRSFAPLIVIGVILSIVLAISWVKAPPDTAIIVTGPWRKPRILIGRTGIRIPFLERIDRLTLKPIIININKPFLTQNLTCVGVKAVSQIQISIQEEMVELAMNKFLNKTPEEIMYILENLVQGTIFQIIHDMESEFIYHNITSFKDSIKENIESEIGLYGMKLTSFHLLDISCLKSNKIEKEFTIAKTETDIAKAEAKIEAAIANVNALNAQVEVAIHTTQQMSKINKVLSSVAESSCADSKALELPETEEYEARINHIEARMNHIGEMIRKDFETD